MNAENYRKQCAEIYDWYCQRAPLYDIDGEDNTGTEQLITCQCSAEYRVKTDTKLEDLMIYCGNCSRHISMYHSLSTHSGGVFNATVMRER